ncbi:MAG: hypothetical protein GXY50_02395 [Syntrophomonadaceae bacterium]|nr:hypothetical protein [Syntrophomonadaceae bacterium]
MGIISKAKNSKIQYILLVALVIGLVFGVLSLTYASETLLHDEAPGTIITFSGKQWTILDQMPNGETYLFLRLKDGDRVFDPDRTNMYDPTDTNNIAYYLNNDFYNSLSQNELINEHSWDRSEYGDIICKIGLISEAEYRKYFQYYDGNILRPGYYMWWTRETDNTNVRTIHQEGNMYRLAANGSAGVHPTLYLKPNILIDQNKAVLGELIEPRPNTPEDFSVSSNTSYEVVLSWQANTEEELAGYRIYRDDIMIAELASISYADNNVLPGMTYKYAISAYNTEDKESDWSIPITVTTPPAKPTSLNGEVTERTVYLTWEASGNPSYIIERSTNETDFEQVAEVTDKYFTETHALWDTTYYYRIAQKGQDGAVSAYAEMQVTTETVPAPTGLTVTKDGNEISLSWEAAKSISTYIIERSTDGQLWEGLATVNTTKYTDLVTEDVGYYYRVRSDGGNQISEPSNIVGVSVPANPPDVQASVSDKTVTLTWNAQNVSGYKIYVNNDLREELPGDAINYSFDGESGITYKVMVEAFNEYGAAGSTVTVRIGSFTAPGGIQMVGDVASNAGAVFGSIGGLLALALALRGSGPLIEAARRYIGM